jgi:hypothetical protein
MRIYEETLSVDEMRLFPGDLLSGALLSLAILMCIIGILVYRYRRGIGPIFLALSGLFIGISSIVDILSNAEVMVLGNMVRLVSLGIGSVLGIVAILLWRR